MKMNVFCSLTCFLFFIFSGFSNGYSQAPTKVHVNTLGADSTYNAWTYMKWRKKLFFADQYLKNGSALSAIKIYEMVNEEKPKETYTLNQLGEANYFMRYYEAAEIWFNKLVAIDSIKYPYSQYYLAMSLKYQGKYDEAVKRFDKFQATKFKKNTDEMLAIKSTINMEIEGCRLGIELEANPTKAKVTHLNEQINHPLTDLSPTAMTKNKILFAALSSDSAVSIVDSSNGRFTRFFVAEKSDEGWQAKKLFDFPFNEGNYHVGNGSFTPDLKRFYFTRCVEGEGLKMKCAIYESVYRDTAWSEPVVLEDAINGEDYSSSHPQITYLNGKEILLFSADMPGGFGQSDIWMAERNENGEFVDLKNGGEIINSAQDDITPFYDIDQNMLYYSSKGRVSMGGFDIYSSVYDSINGWEEPVNAGSPINTSVDDLYFVTGATKRSGYLVSNRVGGLSPKSPTCCDDIWAYRYPPVFVFLEGHLMEAGNPDINIEDGEIHIYQADNDSLLAVVPIGEGGKFAFKLPGGKSYRLKATSTKYEDTEVLLNTDDLDDEAIFEQDIFMNKRPFWEGLSMGIVHYSFDKSKLRKDARPVLDTLVEILKSYPTMIIEVSGHTDDMGDTLYNMKLSERRAEAVYNYLVRKGIPKEQLVQKGYGEKKSVALNTNSDGSDNSEGRQLNRRTEFMVIGELEE